MKLLVLAQVPPPHHGQSAMVELLVRGLPEVTADIELHHVNLRLSGSSGDIGRWQPGKFFAARRAINEAKRVIREHGCDTLYYVPAPGKRIALWRDLMVLRALRPHVKKLILHWHASGLGTWLETNAHQWERRAAQRWLGQADLSIVLGEALRPDAEILKPVRVAVVPNGIPDPWANSPEPTHSPLDPSGPVQLLFLGVGSEAKGLFDTIRALEKLPQGFELTFAGEFDSTLDFQKFEKARSSGGNRIRAVGFVEGKKKHELLLQSDILVFPSRYAAEAFPLVILEALAANLAVVTTRWRAIPEMLPTGSTRLIEPGNIEELTEALASLAVDPESPNTRSHFLEHFTQKTHLENLAAALRSLS